MQIPLKARVSDLTESQITALSSFLSSPSTSPRPAPTPLATPSFPSGSGSSGSASSSAAPSTSEESRPADPLEGIKVETDLRRSVQADIAHQRQVGSYRGRRYVPQELSGKCFADEQACARSSCAWSEHTQQRKDGEEAQQGRQAGVLDLCVGPVSCSGDR